MTALALAAGFAAATGLRVAIGGPGLASSPAAGLAFAACLAGLALAAGTRVTASARDLRLGLAGAALICTPAVAAAVLAVTGSGLGALSGPAGLLGTTGSGTSAAGFSGLWGWLPVVSVVAAAEEWFLRGALYSALGRPAVAVTGSAVAFALLHVPLYGWAAVPLDLAVGIVLGLLRHQSGSATAPAVAHVAADWAAWFLR
jgi:membrane protease YdiL (CAAX protease family)